MTYDVEKRAEGLANQSLAFGRCTCGPRASNTLPLFCLMTHKRCSSRRHEKKNNCRPRSLSEVTFYPPRYKSINLPDEDFGEVGEGRWVGRTWGGEGGNRGGEGGELGKSKGALPPFTPSSRAYQVPASEILRWYQKCCIHFLTQFVIINQNSAVNRQREIKLLCPVISQSPTPTPTPGPPSPPP